MTRAALLEHAYEAESAFLDTLTGLVERESPTNDKRACDALADHLQRSLVADGWLVERHARQQHGDILEARLAAPDSGGPRTLLLTHYDTVWPLGTLERMPIRHADDTFSGPGSVDMKAGIANAMHAVKLLETVGVPLAGDVTLLLTSDEETGSDDSRQLIEELARKHDRVLVLEPGREDGALKTGRKGTGGYRVTFHGKSAHAGNNPADGASALRELARFLLYVEDLADEVAGTTVNLTMAQGGFAANVIAEEATAVIDMRVLKASEGRRIDQAIRLYEPRDQRVTLTITGGMNRPPLELTEANEALFELAQSVLGDLGLDLDGAVVGGGSDGNFTSALGVATLDGLGSVGGGPHARHEHIRVKETLERMALLAGLLASS